MRWQSACGHGCLEPNSLTASDLEVTHVCAIARRSQSDCEASELLHITVHFQRDIYPEIIQSVELFPI
jgi:hypothetical protein